MHFSCLLVFDKKLFLYDPKVFMCSFHLFEEKKCEGGFAVQFSFLFILRSEKNRYIDTLN